MNKTKGKTNAEMTLDELKGKAKTLRAITAVVSTLIVLYAAYFVYSLIQGTWRADNTLGVVGIGTLGVLVSTLSVQLAAVGKEINSRNPTD